jgi:hypothetical protein
MNVSREYSLLCILFGLEFTLNNNNVTKARSELESYDDLEVCCYRSSERNPMLVPKERKKNSYDSFTYKKYLLPARPSTYEADENIYIKIYIIVMNESAFLVTNASSGSVEVIQK